MKTKWTFKQVGAHWDRTEDYDDINKETYSYYRRFTDSWKMVKPFIKDGSRILDICCRTANGTMYYGRHLKKSRFVLADVSRRMLKIGSEAAIKEGIRPEKVYFEKYPLPFKNGEFDVILCLETIEHMPNPYRFTREMARILKPGGIYIMSTPNVIWEPFHWFAAVTKIHHSEGPHRFIRHGTIKRWHRKVGFKNLRYKTTVIVPIGPKWFIRFGEWFERTFQNSLTNLLGLRRIYIERKIKK